MGYSCNIKYKQGSKNIADFLSRNIKETKNTSNESKLTKDYVNFVKENSVPYSMSLQEIKTVVLMMVVFRRLLNRLKKHLHQQRIIKT